MGEFSKFFISSLLFLTVSKAHSGGSELICETFDSTEKGQISGYIDLGEAIISAGVISDSVTSESDVISSHKSITKFSIKKIWKDQVGLPTSEIEVYTYYPEQIDYSRGKDYLLYLSYSFSSGTFITNVCVGTKNIKDASKLEFNLL